MREETTKARARMVYSQKMIDNTVWKFQFIEQTIYADGLKREKRKVMYL